MSKPNRRYIFVDFENFRKIKFKKLEKVCDKVFVFIDTAEQSIPFSMVVHMQRLGKGLKWVGINNPLQKNMNYHMCFLLGRLHQKVGSDIEFAILSNDKSFDPLVDYINSKGRSCIRVKRKKTDSELDLLNIQDTHERRESPTNGNIKERVIHTSTSTTPIGIVRATKNNLIEETARETVKRLIRSGNRPAEVETLKSYIELHNQEMTLQDNTERVIERLEETKEIQIQNTEVIYNF